MGLLLLSFAAPFATAAAEHSLMSAGLHEVKSIQAASSAIIAGGEAELSLAEPPYGVLLTRSQVTEPPIGPSRYAFLAFIADQQAMYAFEGRRDNALLARISFAFVWNETASPQALADYDDQQELTHDDLPIVVAHAFDNNHVTIWCLTRPACDEVHVDVRNALHTELKRHAVALSWLTDLEAQAEDLSSDAEELGGSDEITALVDRVGQARVLAAQTRLVLAAPPTNDGVAIELRGPIRTALSLLNERAQDQIEMRIDAATVGLDRALAAAHRAEELALRARTAEETREALDATSTSNWIAAASTVLAAVVAVAALFAWLYVKRPRFTVEDARWAGGGLQITLLNPTEAELSVQSVELIVHDEQGRRLVYPASRERRANVIHNVLWFDEARVPARGRLAVYAPELWGDPVRDMPFQLNHDWPGHVRVKPVGGWNAAKGILTPERRRDRE